MQALFDKNLKKFVCERLAFPTACFGAILTGRAERKTEKGKIFGAVSVAKSRYISYNKLNIYRQTSALPTRIYRRIKRWKR